MGSAGPLHFRIGTPYYCARGSHLQSVGYVNRRSTRSTQPARLQFTIPICGRNELIDPSGKTPTAKTIISHRLPNHEPIAHSTTGATHKQTTPMRDPGKCKHTLNRSNPEGQPSDSRGKGALRLDDAFMTDRGRPSIAPAIRRDPPGGHHDNLHIPLLLADFTWPRNMGRATQCDNTRHQDAPQKTVQQRARDNID